MKPRKLCCAFYAPSAPFEVRMPYHDVLGYSRNYPHPPQRWQWEFPHSFPLKVRGNSHSEIKKVRGNSHHEIQKCIPIPMMKIGKNSNKHVPYSHSVELTKDDSGNSHDFTDPLKKIPFPKQKLILASFPKMTKDDSGNSHTILLIHCKKIPFPMAGRNWKIIKIGRAIYQIKALTGHNSNLKFILL